MKKQVFPCIETRHDEFGEDSSGSVCLISAGVHGDEYEPLLAIRRLAGQLDQSIIHGKVILHSPANPGACALGSRYGEDGLDLARVCPGKETGSPTEQAASRLSQAIAGADYYLDLHTGGRTYDLYPFVGYFLHSDHGILQRQREIARGLGLGVAWGTNPGLEGRSLSVARDCHIPALYVEAGGPTPVRAEMIEMLYSVCLAFLHCTGFVEGIPGDSFTRVIEDASPGSGHLQLETPSPDDGIFVPSGKPGDLVEKGDAIGILTPWNNPSGNCQVRTGKSGMLIGIRADPNVKKGESLGVII